MTPLTAALTTYTILTLIIAADLEQTPLELSTEGKLILLPGHLIVQTTKLLLTP